MNAPAEELGPFYVGIPVEPCGDYLFGMELVTQAWPELTALGEEEWLEVQDDKLLGDFKPDFAACAAHERRGNICLFSVRSRKGAELVGYVVGVVGMPLKTAGHSVFNEVGLYLRPDHRAGWLFSRFLRYCEQGAKHLGCSAIVLAHRVGHDRVGLLLKRAGFKPLSVDYIKFIDRGSDETHE